MWNHSHLILLHATCFILLLCSVHCAPRNKEMKHGKPRRPHIPMKAMAEYLTRARMTGPSTKYRTENLEPNARVFEWLDRLIFGSSQKQPYHGTHSHDYHHAEDDHGYYDDYNEDDCHHHHHDYDDYHNTNRFHASNSQQGQSVSAAPQIQIYPLSVDGFMKPLLNHHSSIPAVGVGFPFSNSRDKEEKRTPEAAHKYFHDGNGLVS